MSPSYATQYEHNNKVKTILGILKESRTQEQGNCVCMRNTHKTPSGDMLY